MSKNWLQLRSHTPQINSHNFPHHVQVDTKIMMDESIPNTCQTFPWDCTILFPELFRKVFRSFTNILYLYA